MPDQVVKGGHLTAAKEDAADAEEVARVRHKLWIVIAVLFFLGMIVWCGPNFFLMGVLRFFRGPS